MSTEADLTNPMTWTKGWRRFAVITAPVFFPLYFAFIAIVFVLMLVIWPPVSGLTALWRGEWPPERPYEM